jgi:hypothetical protein
LEKPEGVQTITGCSRPEVEGGPGRVQKMCEATDLKKIKKSSDKKSHKI